MDAEENVSVTLTKKEWDMIANLVGFAYDTKRKLDSTMMCLDSDCYDNPWMNDQIFTVLDSLCDQAELNASDYC